MHADRAKNATLYNLFFSIINGYKETKLTKNKHE